MLSDAQTRAIVDHELRGRPPGNLVVFADLANVGEAFSLPRRPAT